MGNLSLRGMLRHRIGAAVVLLSGTALVLIGVLMSVRIAPDGVRDLHAYEAAPRCAAAPSEPAECRWTEPFTVTGIHLTGKRGDSDRAYLTSADGTRWKTAYANRNPLLGDLEKGDRVTGTVWRGLLTEISRGGTSQRTQDAPADMRARVLILALIVVPSGLLTAVAGAWRLVRSHPTTGMAATLGLGCALFGAGLFSPVIGGESLAGVAAVWLPVAVVSSGIAIWYTVHKRGAAAA
ncbi:hypothetical protein [Actinomadura verrucosospora]|uniref:Uncharacterized protein n=1 Tax=Actinomadura verrucosospora TaxID=46165 RepID=A0A7D4A7Z0_ACTVE|nr:hypothetical protein [Actinomadura verrucosospora]QKG23387.1 hypothetical protein ACTIVE_5030 [Actinomadura verrucosospora]